MYKNTIVLIIIISGCSEVNIKVSNANVKSVESNNCRKLSEDNKDLNGMLAMI